MKNIIAEAEGLSFTGFKLIEFELQGSKLFGDIKYSFIDGGDKQKKIYSTVLIGQNGTLKSRLFQKIVEFFWSLHDIKNERPVSFADKFSLKYSTNGSIYEFSNILRKEDEASPDKIRLPYIKANGKFLEDLTKVELPASVIAIAIMITDRFPFPDANKFPIYQYLGSRYRPQLASSKTFINRVVEFVSKNIDSEAFIHGIRKIVREFLHNSNQPCISFHTQNTPRFFKGKMSIESFYSYFEEINERYKDKSTTPPFKLGHYKRKIKEDPKLKKEIVDYCNFLKENNLLRDFPKTSAKAISFNLLEEKDVEKLRKQFVLLDHMRQLGIVQPAEIEFLKSTEVNGKPKLEGYSIIDSSSGEYNLLGSMIGIIASIQPNSILFIDEPEISLHPNWQMKYLSFLNSLLTDENYATCHILVATHSHFLISDLDGKHSSVIVLNRDEKTHKLSANLLKETDTYGWSAEDVLYNVFNVATTRNLYVAKEIGEILKVIAKKDIDLAKLKSKNAELEKIKSSLKPTDPLKSLIIKVQKEFIKNV